MVGPSIGPYRILERLGAGGMGEVYLAEDPRLRRRVALKTVSERRLGDPDARRRLLREARAAANLNHPNIAAIYDILELDDRAHIVMEYVPGDTLATLLKNGPLSPARAVEIAIQLADALDAAHAIGIVHRDLKPANVVLTLEGKAKVLDFGLAKSCLIDEGDPMPSSADITPDGAHVIGTPPYMSPEQLRGQAVDARSDLYSFGVLLFEMLAGRRPRPGRDPYVLLSAILNDPPPSARAVNPSVPPELDAIVARAMAREPEARYASAAAMRADLARATGSSSDVTTPSTAWISPPRRLRRWKWPGIAAISLLIATAVVLRFGPRFPTASDPPPHDARRWYEQGADALREGAYLTASKRLEQAIALHDAYPLAHARLAEARAELDDDRAKDSLLYVQKLVPDLSRLPRVDALYLEGIRSMVSRRFPDAIQAYSALAAQFPQSSHIHFDLGRAYEANDEIAKAVECYERASTLDPQSPAPYLRLGVLHGQKQQIEQALAAFGQAHGLYDIASNQEGLAEITYRRGVLYDNLDKSTEARKQLDRALTLASQAGNAYQQVRVLLRIASVEATQGHFGEAETIASQAATLARDMRGLTATALTDLGNVYFAQGDFDQAGKHFLEALTAARRNHQRMAEARALLSLGSLRISQNAIAEGVAFVNQALPHYQQRGYRKEATQAFTLLAAAYEVDGQFDKAVAALESQLRVAVDLSDASLIASTHDILANTLLTCERYPEALHHAEAALETHRIEVNRPKLAFALMHQALALGLLGRDSEARGVLESLRETVGQDKSSRPLLARAERIAGYVAAAGGRLTEAETLLREAVRAEMSDDFAIEAMIELGRVTARAGGAKRGLALTTEALRRATRLADRNLQVKALLGQAEVLLAANQPEDALAAALRLLPMVDASRLMVSAIRARLISARAAERLGRNDDLRAYEAEASGRVTDLKRAWGSDVVDRLFERADLKWLR